MDKNQAFLVFLISMKEFLTINGLNELRAELEERKQKRGEIAARLAAAAEKGDLTENAEYTAAREEQMFNESRIQELEAILREAEIINSHPKDGTIGIGSKITLSSNGEKKTYQLVGSLEANPTKGLISEKSPLGQALIGKKAGQTIKVKTVQGVVEYKITKVE